MRSRHTHLVIMLLVVAGCGDDLGPARDLAVYVDAHPTVAQEGDSVTLDGVAHNGSNQTIMSSACGPGIRFTVLDSLDVETELMGGAWTCPMRDSNELLPGETDVYTWEWMPPGPGTYRVRSYVRVDDGPTIYSRAQEVQIFADPDGM